MKPIIPGLLSGVLLIVPWAAYAGKINGTIREGGRPLKNAPIVITCGDAQYTGMTNARGAYSIHVAKRGRCTFAVSGKPGATKSISSSKNPVRYDFVLKRSQQGYTLQRR